MVIVVDPFAPTWVYILRPWKIEELLLKEAKRCGLTRDFGQYFGISGSVLAQQFYTTARHFLHSFVVGVENRMTEHSASSRSPAPLCPALIGHGNWDQLVEMVLHFGSGLAARGVLTDVDLLKLVPQYWKRTEQLKQQWQKDVGVPIVDNVGRIWLMLPSWKIFPMLHKVVQIMLVLSTSGCYHHGFIDDNLSVDS